MNIGDVASLTRSLDDVRHYLDVETKTRALYASCLKAVMDAGGAGGNLQSMLLVDFLRMCVPNNISVVIKYDGNKIGETNGSIN